MAISQEELISFEEVKNVIAMIHAYGNNSSKSLNEKRSDCESTNKISQSNSLRSSLSQKFSMSESIERIIKGKVPVKQAEAPPIQ